MKKLRFFILAVILIGLIFLGIKSVSYLQARLIIKDINLKSRYINNVPESMSIQNITINNSIKLDSLQIPISSLDTFFARFNDNTHLASRIQLTNATF
jgi:hypothetical protein